LKLVLDTNICVDFAAGVPETVEFIATNGEYLFLPSIVIGELEYGFRKGPRQQLNERKLQQFINRLRVDIIPVNSDVARKYASIYLSLRGKGTTIPINDVWIAACCMEVGGTLLSHDKHFQFVSQIETVVLSSSLV
jgi:predicted nucleic acid-binding protein